MNGRIQRTRCVFASSVVLNYSATGRQLLDMVSFMGSHQVLNSAWASSEFSKASGEIRTGSGQ